MNILIKNIKSFFTGLCTRLFPVKVNIVKEGQHMLEFLGDNIPYDCLDLVSTFLSCNDIYTLSTISKYESSKLRLMMSLRFIKLSKAYSRKYIQNDNFKYMIDNITTRYKFGLEFNGSEGIVDISRLSTSFNLSTLIITSNQLVNINPLRNLVELTEIDLSYNEGGFDTRPFLKLVKLRKLILNNCSIRNIKSLSRLTNLVELDLSENYIRDLTPLKSLSNLNYLNLYRFSFRADTKEGFIEVKELVESLPKAIKILCMNKMSFEELRNFDAEDF